MRIKNWERFQHFRDRRPPWIKLYRDLLDDEEFHSLDGQSAKILIMLWLLASEDCGKLRDIKNISFRLRLPEKVIISAVSRLSHWLEQNDTEMISERYLNVPLETETEKEEETERKKYQRRFSPPLVEDVSQYCKERSNGVDPQSFVDFYTSKGWRVGNSPMRDWKAAVRTWEKRSTKQEQTNVCSFNGCKATTGIQQTRSGRSYCKAHMPM